EGLPELLDVGDGNARVRITEEAEPRGGEGHRIPDQWLEKGDARGHDATAVESHARTERASRRDQKRHPAAEAEANESDPGIVEACAAEVSDRGIDVGNDAVVAHPLEERQHL